MDVWLLQAGGIYGVKSESGNLYRVDVGTGECTCPDAQDRDLPNGCKHLRRVRFKIEGGTVPRPDGRIPSEPCNGPDRGSRSTGSDGTDTHVISRSYTEFDKHGEPTGATYYRCSCGREALRRRDLRLDGCGEGGSDE